MKRFAVVLGLLLLLAFIWGNSLIPSEYSKVLSEWLTTMLGGEIVKASDKATSWLTSANIRTAAHLSEFAALGFVATKYINAQVTIKCAAVLSTILFGILVALADETIQIFNDRFSSVEDVWVDIAGFMLGFLIAQFFFRSKSSESEGK